MLLYIDGSIYAPHEQQVHWTNKNKSKSNKQSSNKTNKSLWVSEFVDFKYIRPFCLNEANSSMDYYELFSNCMAVSSMATEPWY